MKAGLIPLIVDDREPKDLIAQLREKMTIEVKRLESGDFQITDPDGKSWAFERKRTGDFVGSWFEGRLADQLARMQEEHDFACLIYEDDMTQMRHNDEWRVRRHLQTINFNFPVLFCRDRRDLLSTIKYYYEKITMGEVKHFRVPPEIQKASSPVVTVYCSFPGVGLGRAEAIAKAYPEPGELVLDMMMNGGGKWAKDIQGVGKKSAIQLEKLILKGVM